MKFIKLKAINYEIISRIIYLFCHCLVLFSNSRVTQIYMIRKNFADSSYIEVSIAILGNVDAGKSTLCGVLCNQKLDDGKGAARLSVLAMPHEKKTGRTSSISDQFMCFNSSGDRELTKLHSNSDAISNEAAQASSKVIHFVDLAGHEKYLRTTISGFSGYTPDIACIVVGANHGDTGTFKEHLGLCLAFEVPFFIVFTKIDSCPDDVRESNLKAITSFLRSRSVSKTPFKVKNLKDAVSLIKPFAGKKMVPIFQVSNVNGHHIDILSAFLNLIQTQKSLKTVLNSNSLETLNINEVPGPIVEVIFYFFYS